MDLLVSVSCEGLLNFVFEIVFRDLPMILGIFVDRCRRLRIGCLKFDLELLDAISIGDAGYLSYHRGERFSFDLPVIPGLFRIIWLWARYDPKRASHFRSRV